MLAIASGTWIVLVVAAVVLLAAVVANSGKSAPNPGRALAPEEVERVRGVLRTGNKLEAIKLHRELSGAGLREAKDAVDAMDGS
jgi:ribosomal protein L7/L12